MVGWFYRESTDLPMAGEIDEFGKTFDPSILCSRVSPHRQMIFPSRCPLITERVEAQSLPDQRRVCLPAMDLRGRQSV